MSAKWKDEPRIVSRMEVTPRWSSRDSAWGTLRWVLLWLVGTALFYLILLGVGAI